jgi:site-specific DNA recombinase
LGRCCSLIPGLGVKLSKRSLAGPTVLFAVGAYPNPTARPIRSETRATLVASIARARRWLNELVSASTATAESIAKREGCSIRKVNMTTLLAFLAPDLVKAAIEGRLPRGMGVARLVDMPVEWSRQRQLLGLPAQ